ncbi:ANR-like protein [Mya arenaria]|uniref:ANR-like protein n=1 Tax=Mya arenaria TaxID=6604 RepID=A0ABY7EMB8_MYAAR|nr:ANR-like protein [Mya arenaria]
MEIGFPPKTQVLVRIIPSPVALEFSLWLATMNTTRSIIVGSSDEGLYWLNNDTSEIVDKQMGIENGTINTNITDTGRNEGLAQAEIAVLGAILCMALLGNLIVIVVLMYKKRKLSRMQMFIIHLAVLPQLVMDITFKFDGNNFLCKLVKYMQVGTMYSSTYVLIMTALDRYLAICHPLNSQIWTRKRVHVMAAIAWILSAIFSLPQLFIFSYKQRFDGVYDCMDNFDLQKQFWTLQAYVTWIFISVYAVPFVILTICYTKICHVVWVSVNAKETHNAVHRKTQSRNGSSRYHTVETVTNPRAHSKKMIKSKIKTVKLTLTVVICFIVCWAPFFITQMWSAFDMNAPYFTSHIMAIATLLASLNSCTNPWIYLAFSNKLCNRRKPTSMKTWMSTANTYMSETERDHLRMRQLNPENMSLSLSRSFND